MKRVICRIRNSWAIILVIATMMSACGEKGSPNAPKLGQTFDETETLCGHGKVEYSKETMKLVVYTHLAGVDAKAGFFDGKLMNVWYDIGAKDVEDKQLQYYLQLNAQGHNWTLVDATTDGWLTAHWKRDDGAAARCGGNDGPYLYITSPVLTK